MSDPRVRKHMLAQFRNDRKRGQSWDQAHARLCDFHIEIIEKDTIRAKIEAVTSIRGFHVCFPKVNFDKVIPVLIRLFRETFTEEELSELDRLGVGTFTFSTLTKGEQDQINQKYRFFSDILDCLRALGSNAGLELARAVQEKLTYGGTLRDIVEDAIARGTERP